MRDARGDTRSMRCAPPATNDSGTSRARGAAGDPERPTTASRRRAGGPVPCSARFVRHSARSVPAAAPRVPAAAPRRARYEIARSRACS